MDNRTAWIILLECFGEPAVEKIKPSSLSASNIGDVQDLLDGVIEAYRSDNRITNLLGFHSYSPPGFMGVLAQSAKSVVSEGDSEKYVKSTRLPFYDEKFHEWMSKPSLTRGMKLREFMQQIASDPPAGWNETEAQKVVSRNAGAGSQKLILEMMKLEK